MQDSISTKLKAVLESEECASLLEADQKLPPGAEITLKTIRKRLAHFGYQTVDDMAKDFFSLATALNAGTELFRAIARALEVQHKPEPPRSDTASCADNASIFVELRSPHVRELSALP